MKILIIEDEYPAAERLELLLRRAKPNVEIIGTIESVAQGVKWFQSNEQVPDLIFTDIELTDGLSFEIFEQVGVTAPLVFTTSYDAYALRAFELNSLHYLLKPLKPTEVAAALEKYSLLQSNFRAGETIQRVQAAARQLGAQRNRFLIETGERLLSLNVEEIAYFYTRENNVYAVTLQGQRYPIRLKMEQLEQELSEEQFFRANRQYLVQIKAVKVAHLHFNGKLKLELIPQAADEVLVSREKATSFKQWMGS